MDSYNQPQLVLYWRVVDQQHTKCNHIEWGLGRVGLNRPYPCLGGREVVSYRPSTQEKNSSEQSGKEIIKNEGTMEKYMTKIISHS